MTAHLPPILLPKVRSKAIMAAAEGYPCTLRVAGFVGLPCASVETTVTCHMPVLGKGVATKVSDMAGAFGCSTCHDIIDGRHPASAMIAEKYPAALMERMLKGLCETHAHLIAAGVIVIPDGEII